MSTMESRPYSASSLQSGGHNPAPVWNPWPVHWSGIVVGSLATVAVLVIIGLVGLSIGAHLIGPEHRVVDLRKVGTTTLILSVFGSFLSFVVGGWVAGKIAGILRSEPAMLHGAIVWTFTIPLVLVLIACGGSTVVGGWLGGLAGMSAASHAVPFERPSLRPNPTPAESAQYEQAYTEYVQRSTQWREETPKAIRNTALGAITALLLGLVGSVVGGWMACGEPMTLTHHRHRRAGQPKTKRRRKVTA